METNASSVSSLSSTSFRALKQPTRPTVLHHFLASPATVTIANAHEPTHVWLGWPSRSSGSRIEDPLETPALPLVPSQALIPLRMRHISCHSKSNKGTKPARRYDRGSCSHQFQGQARMFYNFESCLMETFSALYRHPVAVSTFGLLLAPRRMVSPGIPPPVARQSLGTRHHRLVSLATFLTSLEPIP